MLSVESAYDTAFTASGAADHGELSGLADDDHSQYLLADGTRNLDGNLIIDNTATEALLVRKNADAGDVFIVDTTNDEIEIPTGSIKLVSTTGPVQVWPPL